MTEETNNLNIENYNGPLDLLLNLVKDKQMDIFDINVAELATSYVQLIQRLKSENIDLAAEYLVMASTLIHIKAKLLLENPKDQEEAEVEKKEILKQLIEYQQFKKISESLRIKELERGNFYIKNPEDFNEYKKPIDESKLDGTSDAVKLIMQMRKMFERIHSNMLKETTIEKFNLSPAERRIEIIDIIKKTDDISFEKIFSVPSLNHFVITMLTVLDMSRKQELILIQDNQFDEIKIKKGVINE